MDLPADLLSIIAGILGVIIMYLTFSYMTTSNWRDIEEALNTRLTGRTFSLQYDATVTGVYVTGAEGESIPDYLQNREVRANYFRHLAVPFGQFDGIVTICFDISGIKFTDVDSDDMNIPDKALEEDLPQEKNQNKGVVRKSTDDSKYSSEQFEELLSEEIHFRIKLFVYEDPDLDEYEINSIMLSGPSDSDQADRMKIRFNTTYTEKIREYIGDLDEIMSIVLYDDPKGNITIDETPDTMFAFDELSLNNL